MMISRLELTAVLLMYAMILLAGCSVMSDYREADNLVADFYQAISEKDFERTVDYCSKNFLKEVPPEEWVEYLVDVHGQLGDFREYETRGKEFNSSYATNIGNTIYYRIQNRVIYAADTALENLVLVKYPDDNEIRIYAYEVVSPSFEPVVADSLARRE